MARREIDEDALLAHLQTIASAKRALLRVGHDLAEEHPGHAGTLLHVCRALTHSADKLLGDTVVL